MLTFQISRGCYDQLLSDIRAAPYSPMPLLYRCARVYSRPRCGTQSLWMLKEEVWDKLYVCI